MPTRTIATLSNGERVDIDHENRGWINLKRRVEQEGLKVICLRVVNSDVGVDDYYENKENYFVMNKIVVTDIFGGGEHIDTLGVGFTDGVDDEIRIVWYDKSRGFAREQEKRKLVDAEPFLIKNYDK